MKTAKGKSKGGLLLRVAGALVLIGAAGLVTPSGREMLVIAVMRVMEERSAVRTVRQYGLDPTRENLELYKLAHAEPEPWPEFTPRVDHDTAPEDRFFAEGLTYGDLRTGAETTIAMYWGSGYEWDAMMPVLQPAIDRAARHGIHLRPLDSEAAFREALLVDNIVIFVGHANHGRGMMFHCDEEPVLVPVPGANPIVPAPFVKDSDEILERINDGLVRIRTPGEVLPVDRCRLFVNFGCRTEPYYGEVLAGHYPDTGLILCWYVWSVSSFIVDGLVIMLQGLENERPLSEIMERWEGQIRGQLFTARSRERGQFQDPGPYPEGMLIYRPPASAKRR